MPPTKRRPSRQLDREIAQALGRRAAPRARHRATARDIGFTDLIRDDDPSAMQVAEDYLLERGQKLREATGGMRARNFTIDMAPLAGPSERWKMVQVSVFPAGRAFPGYMTAEYTVANGPVRWTGFEQILAKPDDAKKMAVATAWAIAKRIKPLSFAASQGQIASIAEETIADGSDNLNPEDLF